MADFAQYYIEYLTKLWQNFVELISIRFGAFLDIFRKDIPEYVGDLSSAAGTFGVVGWILYVLVMLINLTFIFFLCYRIFQIIRRYVIFRAKEVEKDELMEMLAKEKEEVARLTIEKNQLYALKTGYYTGRGLASEDGGTSGPQKQLTSQRFTRLTAIDVKYEDIVPFVSNAEIEGITLKNIVDNFVAYAASQLHLYYEKGIVRQFFAGMATTKVLILEGISGTGKTSLPYAMGKFFGHDSALISVQPSWRDRADLVGYFNEFTKTYNETDFLSSLYEATYNTDPSFIVLDEMNLARIEYYFAEFLSIMEMPDPSEWTIDIVSASSTTDPKHIEDGKLLVPQGVWFVGTANQDDSTFTITDKVYDRTITIDLNTRGKYFDAPLTPNMSVSYHYLDLLFQQALTKFAVTEKSLEALRTIDEFIFKNFKITFGNRIMRQILAFVPVYMACGGTEQEAIDFLLMSKILRKFTSLNLVMLRKELGDLSTMLDKQFGKNVMPLSQAFIKKLLRS